MTYCAHTHTHTHPGLWATYTHAHTHTHTHNKVSHVSVYFISIYPHILLCVQGNESAHLQTLGGMSTQNIYFYLLQQTIHNFKINSSDSDQLLVHCIIHCYIWSHSKYDQSVLQPVILGPVNPLVYIT